MAKIKFPLRILILILSVIFLFEFSIKEAEGYYYSGWGIDLYWGYYPYYYSYYYPYYGYYYYPYDYYYSLYPSIYFYYSSYDYEYEYDYSQVQPQPQPQAQPAPQVDLKAQGVDGPITVPFANRTITLSWTSQYADSCQAFGDWSGSKPTFGSEQITLSVPRTYRFTLTCKNSQTGQEKSDSVEVTLEPPEAPKVITKLITL